MMQPAFQLSRGEQSRRSCGVSKAGIFLAAPSLVEEGERSDARRKEGWCGQVRRLRFTSLKSINNSSIVTRPPSSAMCSTHSGNTHAVPPRLRRNSASPPAAFTLCPPLTTPHAPVNRRPSGRPALPGGNQAAVWPPPVIALLKKRLACSPPCPYSFAASEALRLHAFKLDRAQVRRWAIANQLAHAVPPRRVLAPVRRWQRAQVGELWQLDASPHRWFPHSQLSFPMLNLLDDCSRLFTGSKLYERELLLAYFDFLPAAFGISVSYGNVLQTIFSSSPPLMIAMPVALIAYLGWNRTRYFGNTAPLLIAVLFLILALGAPNFPGQGFHLTMLVFLFVFVAGVFADLLETQQSLIVTAGLCGLLGASAVWNLLQLWRV